MGVLIEVHMDACEIVGMAAKGYDTHHLFQQTKTNFILEAILL